MLLNVFLKPLGCATYVQTNGSCLYFAKKKQICYKQTLIKLYYSFAYPYLKYGIISWGKACQTSLAKIQVLQNNIIRIMNFKFVKDKAEMCTLFKSMKILKVKDILN